MSEEPKEKKTFGGWLTSIFNAHYRDASDQNTRYINTELKKEVASIGNDFKWARSLSQEFAIMSAHLRDHVSKCPHDQEDKKLKTEGYESCELCGCHRWDKYRDQDFDRTYYERCFDIKEIYKEELSPEEFKILDDFEQRQLGENSQGAKWDAYNARMIEIFKKYPLWGEWRY